jgi:poly(3-hydroxybutyrate) depolymerase
MSCGAAPLVPDTMIAFGNGATLIHVPIHYDRVGVVVLHSLDHGAGELVDQGWSKLSDAKHFIAIYPVRGDSWGAGLCCGYASVSNRDDVIWLTTVIDDVRRRYGLTKVYLVGNSNGAMMVERMLAERPDITDRAAVWAGAPEMPRPGFWNGTIVAFDGSKDTTVPRGGGVSLIRRRAVLIRPLSATSHWLIGASVQAVTVPGAGHKPASDWPLLAWQALLR